MADLDPGALGTVLADAAALKADRAPTEDLAGRSVALIFEKPSTRTRVSFEVGVAELGGTPLVLGRNDLQLGRGETIEDTARVLSRYCHAIVIRTFEHERLERLAAAATVPVVNALSDHEHPCQALADLQTVAEHLGSTSGKTLAYLGDGNNVAHSLMLAGALAGMTIRVATPPGYEPAARVLDAARDLAVDGAQIQTLHDPAAAVAGADVLYTDVWASMGQEDEAEERKAIFAPFQIGAELVASAADDAIVMHCLPAYRGQEITADVLDGPRATAVWDQAENRLHAQKALLRWLLA